MPTELRYPGSKALGMNSKDSQQARGGLPDGKSAEQSPKVFINYRHEDTQFAATMLYHSLMEHFGSKASLAKRYRLTCALQYTTRGP